jgi:hypothetical protein
MGAYLTVNSMTVSNHVMFAADPGSVCTVGGWNVGEREVTKRRMNGSG